MGCWGGGSRLNLNFSLDFSPTLTSPSKFLARNIFCKFNAVSQIISVWRLMNWGTISQLQSWSVEAGCSLCFHAQIILCNEPRPCFSGWLLSPKTFSRICLTKEVKYLLNCPKVSCSFLIQNCQRCLWQSNWSKRTWLIPFSTHV